MWTWRTELSVELLTASYGAWSRRPDMGCPVVCSLLLPKSIPEAEGFPRLWAATPRWSYWRAGWPDEFARHFEAQLRHYGARRIARELAQIAHTRQAPRLVLCCFEPIAADCHRRQFSDWWLLSTGERIQEVT
jgi:hypothetical protein